MSRNSSTETGVKIIGLGSAMTKMKKTIGSLEELQPALQKIARYGANQLRHRTPTRTGKLKTTIRIRKNTRKAAVSIGSKKIYYAPFVNYGTCHQKAQNFAGKAKDSAVPYAQRVFSMEIKKKLRKYGME